MVAARRPVGGARCRAVAGLHFANVRRGPLAWRLSTTRLELIDAALMADTRHDVGPVHAVLSEQQIGHTLERRRSVHVEVRDPVRSLVPPLQHEPPVVHAVVVVQMREERVPYVDGPVAALEEAMVCARPVVHHDEVVANLE